MPRKQCSSLGLKRGGQQRVHARSVDAGTCRCYVASTRYGIPPGFLKSRHAHCLAAFLAVPCGELASPDLASYASTELNQQLSTTTRTRVCSCACGASTFTSAGRLAAMPMCPDTRAEAQFPDAGGACAECRAGTAVPQTDQHYSRHREQGPSLNAISVACGFVVRHGLRYNNTARPVPAIQAHQHSAVHARLEPLMDSAPQPDTRQTPAFCNSIFSEVGQSRS
eukprot:6196097-Pleurochrysis_carterae.AAC.5